MWASKSDGPSGSVGERMMARDGWRVASIATAAIARSTVSGRGATTTSVSTLVRIRTRTPSPSRSDDATARIGDKASRASSAALALRGLVSDPAPEARERVRRLAERVGPDVPAPGCRGLDDLARRPARSQPSPSSTVALEQQVGGRPGPRCRSRRVGCSRRAGRPWRGRDASCRRGPFAPRRRRRPMPARCGRAA